jgi:putative FmdB family regulatory protein
MPLYEYTCETDGATIELLRPMADADKPVEDPENRGRVFKRKHSTFATAGAASSGGSNLLSKNTCCPCGKVGGCGSAN